MSKLNDKDIEFMREDMSQNFGYSKIIAIATLCQKWEKEGKNSRDELGKMRKELVEKGVIGKFDQLPFKEIFQRIGDYQYDVEYAKSKQK